MALRERRNRVASTAQQRDTSHIADASTQRLKQCNKGLAEQLAELKHEVDRAEVGFSIDFGLEMGWRMTPDKRTTFIEENTRHRRADLNCQPLSRAMQT